MSHFKLPIAAILMAICSLSFVNLAAAQGGQCSTPRQYYSEWKKHPQQDYHYRNYYYKPSDTYSGYKHHYVIYTPSKPKDLYYYNPYTKKYWGRCPVAHGGKPLYSQLPPEHRHEQLDQIPEASFPDFGGLPPIPDSTDGLLIDLPPDDLPIL